MKNMINYVTELIAWICGLGGLVWGCLALYAYNVSQNCIKSGTYSWTETINMFNRANELERASLQAGMLAIVLLIVSLISVIIYMWTKESLKEEA